MSRARSAFFWAILCALGIGLLAGCTANTDPAVRVTSVDEDGVPAFAGPFAADYHEAWTRAQSDQVRSILRDEKITDQEWSQVIGALKTCLSARGISVTTYHDDGSYEAQLGDLNDVDANQAMGECEKSSGEAWLGRIYRGQTNNPNNVPDVQLQVNCLIRNGAASSTYRADQYVQDSGALAVPFIDDTGEATFWKCTSDPNYQR